MSFKAKSKDYNKSNDSSKKSSRSHPPGRLSHNMNNYLNYDHNHALIHAQKTIGNHALQRLIHSDSKFNFGSIFIHGIQTKSKPSNPTSLSLQDADCINDINVNMNTPISASSHSSQQNVPSFYLQRRSEKQIESRKINKLPSFAKAVYPTVTVIEDEGKTGSGMLTDGQSTEVESKNKNAGLHEEYNEFGFLDGEQRSNIPVHVFVNGGKTGSAIIHWAGGRGGRGGFAGVITLIAPLLRERTPKTWR